MEHDDAMGEGPVEHDESAGNAIPGGARRSRPSRWPERLGHRVALASATAGVVAVAWWVVGLPPFSAAATAAVLAAGVTAMAWGARFRRPRRPPVDRRAATGWLAVGAAAAAWQLVALVQRPREDHPTLSSMTNALLDSRPARAAAFVAWVAAAAALARR